MQTLAVAASIVPLALSLLAALRMRPQTANLIRSEQAAPAPVPGILRTALLTARSQPRLMFLSAFNMLSFALANAIFWYNQPYYARAGIAVTAYGPLMAGAMAVQMLLLLRIETFQRILGKRLLLALSGLLPGAAYLLLARAHSPAASILLVTGVVAFSGWRAPLVENELNRHISDESRATTLSVLSLTGSLAKAFIDPSIGYLGDLGLDAAGIGLGTGLVALGLLAFWLIPGAEGRG